MGKKVCRDYAKGVCKFGDKCRFRHVDNDSNFSGSRQVQPEDLADAQLQQMTAEIVKIIDNSRHAALLAEVAQLKDAAFTLVQLQGDLEQQLLAKQTELQSCEGELNLKQLELDIAVQKNREIEKQVQELVAEVQKCNAQKDNADANAHQRGLDFENMKGERDALEEEVHRLRASNLTQQSGQSTGSSSRQSYLFTCSGAEWQFQVEENEWSGLPADRSEELHKYFEEYVKTRNGKEILCMKSGVEEYKFDVCKMTQTNVRTGKSRKIRCQFDIPPQWTRCVNMTSIYPTESRPTIEISGFCTRLEFMNGVYVQSEHDTRSGRPVWWKEDGTVMGYSSSGDRFGLLEVSKDFREVLLNPKREMCSASLDKPIPYLPGTWNQVSTSGTREAATTAINVIRRPAASPCNSTPFMSIAVEVLNEGLRTSLQTLMRDTVSHQSAYHGVSLCDTFKKSVNIIRVLRIENWHLWTKYRSQVSQMQRDLAKYGTDVGSVATILPDALIKFKRDYGVAESLANECLLFHGTACGVAVKIALEGFDFRLSKPGYYGQGTYFASQACKSHSYTQEERGLRTMLISRVAIGDISYADKVDKDCRRPPVREGTHRCYDSIVAQPGPMKGHKQGFQTHQEFVVFDKFQAYPELIIQYASA